DRYPGNQDAGTGCAVGGGKRRAPDRASNCVSPGDEEGSAGGDGFWSAGDPVAQLGPVERRGDFAIGMVSRREGAATHFADADRLWIRGSEHGLREDRREMLAL